MIMNKNFFDSNTILQIRRQSGKTQQDFWGIYGVSQGTGSRYERESVPKPIAVLIYLHKIMGLDLNEIYKQMKSTEFSSDINTSGTQTTYCLEQAHDYD